MTQPGESNSVRVWRFTTDAAVWTFYDDTFRGAVLQWLDLMEALSPGFAPAPTGATRIRVEYSELK
jgi:hypothetical protein